MAPFLQPELIMAGLAGLSGGTLLFARGLVAYRRGAVVSSIATSTADSLAAGEVRLTGTIEPLATTLVSALQSEPCVWYHSTITERGRNEQVTILNEERAVEFLLRDQTGTVRVVPRGARWEITPGLDSSTGLLGGDPDGVRRRIGPSNTVTPELDRDAAIADLLTVHQPVSADGDPEGRSTPSLLGGSVRHYQEARLAPGQQITVVGYAVPYGDLDSNAEGVIEGEGASLDPAIAADLDAARDRGALAQSAEEAWGNAAIPGFGIGRPVTPPTLDPGATPEPAADPEQAARAKTLFDIAPETLVVSRGPNTNLVIYAGVPAEAQAHDQAAFYRGLAGAGLATASVVGLAALLN